MGLAELRTSEQHKGDALSWFSRLAEQEVVPLFGGNMTIEVAVPDDWTPGQALAVRQLLQQAMRNAQPVICSVREDVTADQLHDIYDRVRAVIRDTGLAVPSRVR
jgi:hypothetical protein